MATKKCPKCGEENPAEAVMCWACYTPLAGGAAAVAGGGLVTPRGGAAAVTPAATAAAQDEKSSAVDPKIFVVVALLLGAMVIGAFTTGLVGGKPDNTDLLPNVEQVGGDVTGGEFIAPPVAPVAPPTTFAGPTTTTQNPGGTQVVPPQTKVVVPPSPSQPIGTMGVVLNSPNVSAGQALALAKAAKRQFEGGGRWKGMQVVVFNNVESASAFRKYQTQRKGAPLTASQYQELADQGLWANVPVYYETRGKTEYPYSPSASPKNWWAGRR